MRSRKVKNLGFSIFNNKTKLVEKGQNDVVAIIEKGFVFSKDFSCEMRSLLSTKEKNETRILIFFNIFLKI